MIKQTIVKIVVGVIILGVVGSGGSLVTRVWDPVWNPFRPEPEEVIKEMLTKMEGVKTMHSKVKTGFRTIDEKLKKEQLISLIFEGDLDITDLQNPKSAGDFEVTFATEGTQFSLGGQSRVIEEIFFVKLTTIPALPFLQPYLAMLSIDLSKIKNQWIKIDQERYLKSSLETMYAPKIEQQLQKQKEERKEIIKKLKGIFEGKKLYLIKKELPDEEIRDIKTYHYLVTLNSKEAKEVILELLEIVGEQISKAAWRSTNFFEAKISPKITRLRQDMSMIEQGAELIYFYESSYRNLGCDYSPYRGDYYSMSRICERLNQETGQKPVIFASSQEYCAYVPFPVKGYYYCIDSQGNDLTTDIFPETLGYCDGKTFVCPRETTIAEEDMEKAGKKEVAKGLDEFFEKVGEIAAEVWIGKKDHYLYKIKIAKEIDLTKFEDRAKKEEEKKTITIKLDAEFSNFNEPLKIEPPEKSKSLEEILGAKKVSVSPPIAPPPTETQLQARDTKIIVDMNQMRIAAELIYGDNDSYANVRCLHEYMRQFCDDIRKETGLALVIQRSKDEYCAYVRLFTIEAGKLTYYCIDSKGRSVKTNIDPAETGYCDGSTFVCPQGL